jgi:hypothetical protein
MLTRPFQRLIAHQGDWLMCMRPAGRYLATNDTTDTAKEAHQ